MRIAFVSSEIVPFASTGGLGEVAGALPAALQAKGHDIWRVMPLYRRVAEGSFDLLDTGLRFDIPVGHYLFHAEIWKAAQPEPLTYFVRRDEFFDRRELYSLPEREYEDNLERFVFFQKAVVALLDALGSPVDIVHGNDWQCGLLPLYLKHGLHGMGRTGSERTVFTIHNLAFQGIFPGYTYHLTNLPMSAYTIECLEYYGNFSCLKGGLTASDFLTTVSPGYAREIQTEALGCGLDGVLRSRSDRLIGILNGVDYSIWNPAGDPHIAKQYDTGRMAGKRTCKLRLQKAMGLPQKPDVPLLGMVSRLADQKGLDLLADTMPDLMEREAQMVLLGSGQEKYQGLCRQWAAEWPGKFAAKIGFDIALSHQIEAGADIYLMPSRFEPCGLNQMYSLRYGTIPVVHATGGLDDTVLDLDTDPEQGTGFKFTEYTPAAFLAAVDKAIRLYNSAAATRALRKRAMQEDFSWERAAAQYEELYFKVQQMA